MRELVGRLSGLDPAATDSLRIIEYFDTLVEGHVGLEAFLRGAALLTGVASGLTVPERGLAIRVRADGRRDGPALPAAWPARPIGDGVVWIERDGPAHVNDKMVLERLAMGVMVTLDRTAAAHSDVGTRIEQLIDLSLPLEERLRAADRLHLDPHRGIGVLAAPPDDVLAARSRWATVITSVAGPVFVILEPVEGHPVPPRAGIGRRVPPAEVAVAWQEALVALRLTSERRPRVDAAELGALTVLAAGVDATTATPPDVLVLERLVARNPALLDTLEEITLHDSVRAAAAALGVHHSTVQARIVGIRSDLGFDPCEPRGRHRMAMALAVHRLRHTTFTRPT